MTSFQFEFDCILYSVDVWQQHDGFTISTEHTSPRHYTAEQFQDMRLSTWTKGDFYNAFEDAYAEAVK